ncbi:MAG TPA: hypothetical protein PKE69_20300, partial [Pyrinomonadaceae bacterium]|nr:hypothetical protein [Pyrinomonadaceae bacterium]
NSFGLAENLCRNYQVNGQTAWSLLQKAERFQIKIITSLSEFETSKMRLEKINSLDEMKSIINESEKGYIIPFGAKNLIKVQ